MDKNDEAFLKRLLVTFKGEAEEHVQALSTGLIALETTTEAGSRQSIVETVFRETHSLKGAARAVGKTEIETLCQSMEDFLARLKQGRVELSQALLDLLYEAVDLLGKLLAKIDGEPAKAQLALARELRQRLAAASVGSVERHAADGMAAGQAEQKERADTQAPATAAAELPEEDDKSDASLPREAESAAVETAPARGGDTVRVPVARLDAILFQSESLLSAKLTAHQRAEDIRAAQAAFDVLVRQRAKIVPEVRALQRRLERSERREGRQNRRRGDPQLHRLLEYLLLEDDFAKAYEVRLETLAKAAEHDWRTLGGMTDGLLDDVKMALMLPVAAALEVLPKFVRDGSRSQGKEVDFQISGGETEIDRRILEDLRDPLLHLIRNSLDHGIETLAARLAAGKPRRGRIELNVSQMEGGRVEILVADDGAGIALEKVCEAARKLGLPGLPAVPGECNTMEGAQSEEALLGFIFQSGLSTSPIITDLSGRGLGLAIVREKIERLGGSVTVSSRPGAGARFRLLLPLTLSTFRGVHIRCGEREFIFPTMHLAQVARVARRDIATVENRETVALGGQTVSLVRLAQVLDIAADNKAEAAADNVSLVVAGSGEHRIAFQVDEVLGEQEVLVKSLGRQLRRVRNIVGATVLGNGRVVPILHVPDLLQSARRSAAPGLRPTPVAVAERKSLLVAEDSITSRMLLKGILESAGYAVKTAVDGMDAYTQLRTEPFDLLVSDVDMPRMNGFDLTAKVRGDKALAQLPVVLVTALSSPEHKERGAEAGANAYIVKSSFDQSNLLAVIRRLL
ncbi:MAG: hybrid sensor histidine kinase/response regulator [Rhodocyclaceae bacterium]|nr:MAG: hybrid sensor histidine kinase/response regulator [Rhodocyclaceae bacterium]